MEGNPKASSQALGDLINEIQSTKGETSDLTILKQILNDLEFYKDLLDESLEDDDFDLQERKELNQLRDQIIGNATKLAKRDGQIDESEKLVLSKLLQLLQEF